MKRKNKLIFILIMLVLVLNLQNANAEISVTPGSGGVGGGSGCPECAYVYSSDWFGVRLSLYKYDDSKKLTFINSVDLVNKIVASKANTTKYKYGRYSYTKLKEELEFGYYNTNVKLLSTYNFDYITGDPGWGIKLAGQIQKYFGKEDTETKAKIKEMFGANVSLDELPKYYLVAEPTIFYYNRPSNFYTYATGYEYMRVLDTLNGYKGSYKWDLWQAQGNATIRGYLFNGMYNAKDSSKKFSPDKYSDGRYDRYNFLSHNSDTSLIKATSTIIPEKGQNVIKTGYKNSNYEYGAMIFWIGEVACDTPDCDPSCKSECAGKSGDGLLKCAESYCSKDKGVTNATKKGQCITECGYTYTPLSCGGPSKTNGSNTTCGKDTSSNKKDCKIEAKDYYSYRVECETYSTVKYPATLPTLIQAGEGFEYRVRFNGNKTCTFTFDTALWKFEYASAYNDTQRSNYLKAIEDFNKLALTTQNEYKYDSKTADISIKIDEKKNNQNTTTTKKLIAEDTYYEGDKSVEVQTTTLKVHSYHNETKVEKVVKHYVTNSTNGVYYQLPSVCVSSKDHTTVREATTCGDDNGPYNKYFTNIYADKTLNDTNTFVIHEASGMDVTNDCNYRVTTNNNDLSCYITVGPSNACSNAVMDNKTDITFTLHAVYKNKSRIIEYNLDTTGYKTINQTFNGKKTYVIGKNIVTTSKTYKVYGTVKEKDGVYLATCDKEVIVTPQKCEWIITKNPSTGETTVALKEISDATAKYYTKLSTSKTWLQNKSIKINKNVKATVNGKIVTSSATYTCEYKTDCSPLRCKDEYLPAQKAEIREYCTSHWHEDKDNYSSFDDCYTSCTTGTDTCKTKFQCTELDKIRNYCKTYFANDGYETEATCVNDCACGDTTGIDYYYRTIENNNPFPQREANANWLGFEKYITNDEDDITSSTTGNPEYEIVLDEGRINKIKADSKRYNSTNGNDVYNDYVWEDDEPLEGSPYKSKFIHNDDTSNGGFRSYFTYIEGTKTS